MHGMGEDCTSEGRIELARQRISLSDSLKQAANGQPDLRAKIKARLYRRLEGQHESEK